MEIAETGKIPEADVSRIFTDWQSQGFYAPP